MLSRPKSKTLRAQKQPGPQSSLSPLHHSNAKNVGVAAQSSFSNSPDQYAAATAPSLSAAAAAAALRNNPTPRTDVAQVQTKRNLHRRSSSLSSASSSRHGFSRLSHIRSSSPSPAPPRSPSVSSMTRRTFRSASRTPSLSGETTSSVAHHLPQTLRSSSVSSSVGRNHTRSSSEHMSAAYTTNNDMSAPLDAAVTIGQPMRPRASSHNSRPTSPSPSINFSYPRLNKTASPDAIVEEPGDAMVYDANSRRLVPKSQLDALNRDLQIAGENSATPGLEKGSSRRGTRARPKSGSAYSPHSHATSGPASPTIIANHNAPAARPASIGPARRDTGSTSPSGSIPTATARVSTVSTTAQSLLQPAQTRRSQVMQLGDVHDPVSLSQQDVSPAYAPHPHSHTQSNSRPLPHASSLDKSPPAHALGSASGSGSSSISATHPKSASAAAAERANSPSYSSIPEAKSVFIQDQPVNSVRFVPSHGSSRPVSHLPASSHSSERSPPVSQQPSTADTEMTTSAAVRHAPLGRSVPPGKSVLKNPNAAASSAQSGLAHGKPGSISDDGSVSVEIPNHKRVSFDNKDIFVPPDDHDASDSGSFTQKMRLRLRNGLNLSRKKEREDREEAHREPEREPEREFAAASTAKRPEPTAEDIRRADPDPFTGMGILPTLPNFTDVFRNHKRDDSGISSKEDARKNAAALRPAPSHDYPGPESHHLPTIRSGTELNTEYLEADSQFDYEDIVVMDQRPQVFKHEANTSRFREPLPPLVTTVDGTGLSTPSPISDYSEDVSGTGSGLDSMDDFNPSVTPIATDAPADLKSPNYALGSKSESLTVPQAAAVQSSNQQSNTADVASSMSSSKGFGVPGGFPRDSNSSLGSTDEATSAQDTSKIASPQEKVGASSSPARSVRFADDLPTRAAEQQDDDSDTDSDGSSVYSDAYESFDNGGFQSLNAVVMASPIVPSLTAEPVVQTINSAPPVTPLGTVSETAVTTSRKDTSPESKGGLLVTSSTHTQSSIIYNTAVSHNVMTSQNSEMDWNLAKDFWRRLSPEERRRLEHEALEGQDPQTPKTPMSPLSVASGLVESPSDILGQTIETNATAQVVPGIGSQYQQVRNISPSSSVSNEDGAGLQPYTPVSSSKLKIPGVSGKKIKKSPRGQDAAAKDTRQSTLRKPRPVSHSTPSSKPIIPPSEYRKRPDSIDNALGVSIVDVARPSLSRQGSSSSFDRHRNKHRGSFGTFGGLRPSLRDSSVSSAEKAVASKNSRFGLRSLSPARNGPAVSARGTAEDGFPKTLRTDTSGEKKGFFGRAKRPSFSRGNSGKKASRFADSSDEEGAANGNRAPFRSRFADSSDEDEGLSQNSRRISAPQPLSSNPIGVDVTEIALRNLLESNQICGIQRNPSPTPSSNSQIINLSGKGVIHKTSLRNTNTRKAKEGKGFMSALRRRKDTSSKIQRAPPSESAARRDTPLERNASQITALRQSGSDESVAREGATGADDDDHSIFEDASEFQLPTSSSDPTGTATTSDMGTSWPLPGAGQGNASLGTSNVVRACDGSIHSHGSSLNVSSIKTSNNNDAPLPSFTATTIMGSRAGLMSLDLPNSSRYGAENDGPLGAGSKKKFGKLRKIFRKTE